jgi:hypothetical protein
VIISHPGNYVLPELIVESIADDELKMFAGCTIKGTEEGKHGYLTSLFVKERCYGHHS